MNEACLDLVSVSSQSGGSFTLASRTVNFTAMNWFTHFMLS